MKTCYDPETDALYLKFSDSAVTESEEIRPGIVFDFDGEGRLVGSKSSMPPSTYRPGPTFPA